MKQIELKLDLSSVALTPENIKTLTKALEERAQAGQYIAEEKYMEAMERTVTALKTLREYPDYQDPEFRQLFVALLFDLAEIHYALKNYKQSEKEVDVLFKVLDNIVKTDEEKYGEYHILAMELSTRILRSRKKTLDLLVKQQSTTGSLYEKVNSGISAATDKLVDSLRTTAQLLASTGDIREALKFYAEAIKYSKKRSGRVSLKEVKLTVEMAEAMIRLRSMRPRAKRLLEAVLPHACAAKDQSLQDSIHSLMDVIDNNTEPDTKWRLYLHKVINAAKNKWNKKS